MNIIKKNKITDFCKDIFIIYYYNSLSLIKNEKI